MGGANGDGYTALASFPAELQALWPAGPSVPLRCPRAAHVVPLADALSPLRARRHRGDAGRTVVNSWTIFLPAGRELPNANRHRNPMQLWRLGKMLGDDVRWMLRAEKVPQLQRAHIVCRIKIRDHRRMDPANFAPAAKAVVDAIVAEGILPDDSHKFVIGPDMRVETGAIRAGLEILIEELPDAA